MNAVPTKTVRFLLVQAAGIDYLLPLDRVRRVHAGLRLHPFPGAAPVVAGLAEVGGEPLVVLDLARLAGAANSSTPATPLTVIAHVGPPTALELAGLAVADVLDIVEVPAEALARVRDGVVSGEAVAAGRTARVLDLEVVGAGP
jgi:chemotaxis signal transduction protein